MPISPWVQPVPTCHLLASLYLHFALFGPILQDGYQERSGQRKHDEFTFNGQHPLWLLVKSAANIHDFRPSGARRIYDDAIAMSLESLGSYQDDIQEMEWRWTGLSGAVSS
ncbi:hypothetical protein C8J56DRAFT_898226 [Mycena floridula]|nr:hypothetical protein C8J56DRAFT_903157 [Mycena floridula]KAJ7578727.1 hypothetical protein C8J56DRAFT_898226 [Mycena floridula]